MRASEFIVEASHRLPIISLKHVNQLKKLKLARMDTHDQRRDLYSVMYTAPSDTLQHLEVLKSRVEHAQQQADLALTQAEAELANKEAVSDMAQSGIEVRQDNQKKVADMAMRAIGRRKKS